MSFPYPYHCGPQAASEKSNILPNRAPQAGNGAPRQHRRYSDSRRRSNSSLIRSSAPGLSVAPMSSMD